MEGSKLNEEVLVDQARSGDVQSFSALVELYQQRAVHAANGLLGNMEDARDAAQEAFVKAYENLDTFKGDSRFYTWFYRILMNYCKDFLRKKKLRQTFSFWFGKEEDEGMDPMANVPDNAQGASGQLLNRELGTQISRAMDALPFRQKSVFVLRYLEGLSLSEIAGTLGVSIGAVKANLWQAGQKMRTILGGALS